MASMKVLVLHTSAWHLGFLGCYGNTWIETPHLDRFAAQAVVFDQHHADCPGHRTCWSGRYDGAPEHQMLPGLLSEVGVRCVVVDAAGLRPAEEATLLEACLDAAVTALEDLSDQSHWLCWVDLPSLQPPWDVPEGFTARYLADEVHDEGETEEIDTEPLQPLQAPTIGVFDRDDLILWERLRCTYAGAVSYLDAGLGLLFEELRARGWLDDLLAIVTSDRGLALGEHGIVGDCQPWLHDEVVHIPLLVRQPGAADAGRHVSALTQPVDLAVTLLATWNVTVAGLDGRSWLGLLQGEVESIRDHSWSHWTCGGSEEWAVRTSEWALLLPKDQGMRALQLYAKPEDRWELNNVIQHHLELSDELQRLATRGLARATC
jgi:arylsulfatase A-like enzyme